MNSNMQEKTGQAMGETKDTAQHAKETTKQKASDTGSYLGQKTEEAKPKAGETTEATKQKAGQTTEADKQKAAEDTVVSGKEKSGGVIEQVWLVHQSRPFRARTRTNELRHALKLNPTAGFSWLLLCFDSQATEQVKSAAAGAKDAVMNTLGMGGDNSKQGDTNTNNSKDSTITRDH